MTTTEETEELRRTVRRFLDQRSTEAEVRRLMEDETGYDPAVWKQMAEQIGLQGLAIPEEFGGSGFSYNELRVVFEEMGRALLTAPFFATVALAANALIECGDDDAKKAYLPGIASGETIATLALSEERGGWDDKAVTLQASGSGSDWTLTGGKRFVPDAHVADLILVAARTADGISLFAVEKGAAGLSTEVELTMDLTRKLARVTLDSTPAQLIGTQGQAWNGLRRALRFAAVALAAEQVGGAQKVLDMTVQYSKERFQFGRPLGSFQALKHKMADMLVDIESAKSAAYDAARAVADGDADVELSASVAKAFCSETYFRTAAQGLQLHGGIGFTWEHPIHLYFKRAKSSEFLLGSPVYHRDLVGQALGI
ncbi:MAG: Isovaleryl-CoA dehydrogenase [Frankiales bacterium]|nr:Isovaleryl-CoA dehydrogenase [Frankiales bacterium]